jgi:DNA-binding NarL/FixJ family response regulator
MNETGRAVRVLVADDHTTAREGVRAIWEKAPDVEVVGEAEDGERAKQMVAGLGPDVLLLDLVMPGTRPSEVEAWVRKHYPETKTLVLTAHDRDAYLAEMVEAGVAGYLIKNERAERLVEAIRCAARGECLITGGQWARVLRWREEVGERWESLSGRERQVLRLLAKGLGNAAIGERLRVTTKTAEYHVTNVLRKLGVASRLEAAAWVRDHLPDELWDSF